MLLLPGLCREAAKQRSTRDKSQGYAERLESSQERPKSQLLTEAEVMSDFSPARENLRGEMMLDGKRSFHLIQV